ncbi:hypothetical protein Tco_1361225 [Tanacetum coccineum]
MYDSTILSESLADSTRSSLLPALLLHPASVVDSDSEHFEDPTSPVVSDSDSFVASLNSYQYEDWDFVYCWPAFGLQAGALTVGRCL